MREIAPEEYYSLAQHVGKNMSKYFYDIAYDETSGVYKNSDTSDIREEIVADAFGTIMGDKGKLESFVQDNRGAWQKIKDIIHDLIISIKRALHKNSQAKLTEKQRFVFGELLAKYEEMETVLNDALERTFEKVSSMTNEGAAEIVEGRGETDVEKRGEAEYNDVKYSRKAKREEALSLKLWKIIVSSASDNSTKTCHHNGLLLQKIIFICM